MSYKPGSNPMTAAQLRSRIPQRTSRPAPKSAPALQNRKTKLEPLVAVHTPPVHIPSTQILEKLQGDTRANDKFLDLDDLEEEGDTITLSSISEDHDLESLPSSLQLKKRDESESLGFSEPVSRVNSEDVMFVDKPLNIEAEQVKAALVGLIPPATTAKSLERMRMKLDIIRKSNPELDSVLKDVLQVLAGDELLMDEAKMPSMLDDDDSFYKIPDENNNILRLPLSIYKQEEAQVKLSPVSVVKQSEPASAPTPASTESLPPRPSPRPSPPQQPQPEAYGYHYNPSADYIFKRGSPTSLESTVASQVTPTPSIPVKTPSPPKIEAPPSIKNSPTMIKPEQNSRNQSLNPSPSKRSKRKIIESSETLQTQPQSKPPSPSTSTPSPMLSSSSPTTLAAIAKFVGSVLLQKGTEASLTASFQERGRGCLDLNDNFVPCGDEETLEGQAPPSLEDVLEDDFKEKKPTKEKKRRKKKETSTSESPDTTITITPEPSQRPSTELKEKCEVMEEKLKPEVESKTQIEPSPIPETESREKIKPGFLPKAESKAQLERRISLERESKTQILEPRLNLETESRAQLEPGLKPEVEWRAKTEPSPKQETEPFAKIESRFWSEAESKVKTEPSPKQETEPFAKMESRFWSEAESKAKTEPSPKLIDPNECRVLLQNNSTLILHRCYRARSKTPLKVFRGTLSIENSSEHAYGFKITCNYQASKHFFITPKVGLVPAHATFSVDIKTKKSASVGVNFSTSSVASDELEVNFMKTDCQDVSKLERIFSTYYRAPQEERNPILTQVIKKLVLWDGSDFIRYNDQLSSSFSSFPSRSDFHTARIAYRKEKLNDQYKDLILPTVFTNSQLSSHSTRMLIANQELKAFYKTIEKVRITGQVVIFVLMYAIALGWILPLITSSVVVPPEASEGGEASNGTAGGELEMLADEMKNASVIQRSLAYVSGLINNVW